MLATAYIDFLQYRQNSRQHFSNPALWLGMANRTARPSSWKDKSFRRKHIYALDLLEWDRRVSFQIFDWNRKRGVRRFWLIALEISGHGLVWLGWPVLYLLLNPNISTDQFSLILHLYVLLLIDIAAITFLKPFVRRPRPSYDKGLQAGTVAAIDQFSFPSGHATRALSIALFTLYIAFEEPQYFSEFAGFPVFAGLVALWGVAVAVSRVALGRHYVLDVMSGAGLGVFYVFLITKLWFFERIVAFLRDNLIANILHSSK